MATLIPKINFKNGTATPTGAITRPIDSKLQDTVSVKDFGAVGDGTTDDTTAIQNAIKALGNNGGTLNFANGGSYLISAPLLLPQRVCLNGNNSTFVGTGTKSVDAIHTAYYVGGVLTDLTTAPLSTHFLEFTQIQNIQFTNFDLAIYARAMCEGCEISFCRIEYCNRAMKVEEPYFLALRQVRADYIQAGLPAFEFIPLNGMLLLDNLIATSCDIGYLFNNVTQATAIKNIDAESCGIGVAFSNVSDGVEISGCYFENITNAALDFSTYSAAPKNTVIHNNFFNGVATGVNLAGVTSTNVKVFSNYWFSGIGKQIDFGSTPSGSLNVIDNGAERYNNNTDFPPAGTPNGAVLTQYSQNSATPWNLIFQHRAAFDQVGGDLLAKSTDYQGTVVPFVYYGDVGAAVTNKVPFCKHELANVVGTAFDVKITTAIKARDYTTGLFSVDIVDNNNSFKINGRFYGTTVVLDTASGKTCVATVVNNVIVLTFSSFSSPTLGYTCTGIVKMI